MGEKFGSPGGIISCFAFSLSLRDISSSPYHRPSSIQMSFSLFFSYLLFPQYSFIPQSEYLFKLDYKWKKSLLKAQEDAELAGEVNRSLIFNILPTHLGDQSQPLSLNIPGRVFIGRICYTYRSNLIQIR